jgi:hypothetical protein
MNSIHTFNIEATEPQAIRNGGTRTMVNKRNFSLLKDMALYSLRLYSGGVREPHGEKISEFQVPSVRIQMRSSDLFLDYNQKS